MHSNSTLKKISSLNNTCTVVEKLYGDICLRFLSVRIVLKQKEIVFFVCEIYFILLAYGGCCVNKYKCGSFIGSRESPRHCSCRNSYVLSCAPPYIVLFLALEKHFESTIYEGINKVTFRRTFHGQKKQNR